VKSSTFVDALTDLRSKSAAHFRSKTLASSNEVAEDQVWSRYHEAVAEVRQLWGEPELAPAGMAYEGPGPRAGGKASCPSPDESFRRLYRQALRIGWWKREGFVLALVVTGHDANSLHLLQLAVAAAGDA
jgi:hypothetical protein